MISTSPTATSPAAAGPGQPHPWPALPLAHYRIEFQALELVQLPRYAGSAWRGALGHALKRTVCVTRERECPRCLLYRACAYPYVFETPPPVDSAKMRRYTAAPHPFVLRPPAHGGEVSPGEVTALGLVLIGRGDRQLPYVVHALRRAAAEGIGRNRGTLELTRVVREQALGGGEFVTVYEPGGSLERDPPASPVGPDCPKGPVTLVCETPVRLRRDNDHLGPEEIGFSDIFSSLLRRVSMLSYFHGETPHETDFAGLTRLAHPIVARSRELSWRDWTRYSSRQDTKLKMGGVVGRMTFEGGEMQPFWPYLWVGQWIHAGRGTSMGLGRYRIETTSLSSGTYNR